MRTPFQRSVDYVLLKEGGLINDPKDPGGITNFGISIVFAGSIHLDINHDGRTDAADIKGLNAEDAKIIYHDNFWSKIHGDDLPPAVAFYLFDEAVNQGCPAATKDLQGCLNLLPDGIIGPKTIMAAHKQYSVRLLHELHTARQVRYAKTKNFDRFGKGWFNRSNQTFIEALVIYNQ